MNYKKGFVIPLIISIIAILAIGGGLYFYKNKKVEKQENNSVASSTVATSTLVGGDRDSHGCIGSAGYSWCEVKNKCLRPWEETCSAITTNIVFWKTYTNTQYGFKVNYPSTYVYNENSGDSSIVDFSASQSPEGVGTKIYLNHSDYENFTDFVSYMKNNYIYDLVKSNENSASDLEIKKEVDSLAGHYSFKTEENNNGVSLLIHSRDFFGFDGANETFVWLNNENGDYLSIVGSDLDIDSIELFTPIKVSCTPNWQCGWTPCAGGYQGMTAVDSNNCGLPSTGVQIACPALARQCATTN